MSGIPPRAASLASTRPAKTGGRAFEPRMVEQEAGQFGACVASDTNNRSLNFLFHDSNIVLRRDSTSAALR